MEAINSQFMKTTVIHHSADFDGIFCREIARKFLGDTDVEYIGWNFGDPPVSPTAACDRVYILDLPCDQPLGLKVDEVWPGCANLVWIDHHKTSIETHPTDIPGYRIDGVAACRLAWQWFLLHSQWDQRELHPPYDLPSKQDFVDRKVIEPLAVRLAGEYDVWDKRDPDAELFQHGLRSRELTDRDWQILLRTGDKKSISEVELMMNAGHPFELRPDGTVDDSISTVKGLLRGGQVLQYARTKENESIIKELGFTFQWEGLTWLACNHARYNSLLFTAGLRPVHDACFGFKFVDGEKPWSISLYHAPGNEHHDLSLIAKKYGGGGHRGACGFQTDTLPFLT